MSGPSDYELQSKGKQNIFLDNSHLELCLVHNVPSTYEPNMRPGWLLPEVGGKRRKRDGELNFPETSELGRWIDFLSRCLADSRTAFRDPANSTKIARSAIDIIFTEQFHWFANVGDDEDTGKTELDGCILSGHDDEMWERGEQWLVHSSNAEGNIKGTRYSARYDRRLKGRASWEAKTIFAQVKGDWNEMIMQAREYGKFIVKNQPGRDSMFCLLLHRETKQATIALIDNAGMYLTRVHNLKNDWQYRRFCYLLAGMYCSSVDAHGFNRRLAIESVMSAEGPAWHIWVFSNGDWDICDSLLCSRRGSYARCTRVWKLRGAREPCNTVEETSHEQVIGKTSERCDSDKHEPSPEAGAKQDVTDDGPAVSQGNEAVRFYLFSITLGLTTFRSRLLLMIR